MTKEELIAVLKRERVDPERAHGEAENALLAYVNDPEISLAWEEAKEVQGWWYA